MIFTPVWQRPEITRIYCAGVSRLMSNFEIDCLTVVSPEDKSENKEIIESHGFKVFEHKNQPLGKKKNAGLQYALTLPDWTHLMELNSDNIVSNELIKEYKKYSNEPFLGCGNFAFYDSKTGRSKQYKYRSKYSYRTCFGIGRLYNRDILEGVKLWDDKAMIGMDNHSEHELIKLGYSPKVIQFDKPVGYDIKSGLNLWNYSALKGDEIKADFNDYSQEEKKLICGLTKHTAIN